MPGVENVETAIDCSSDPSDSEAHSSLAVGNHLVPIARAFTDADAEELTGNTFPPGWHSTMSEELRDTGG
jgi:hypothetical protein